MTNIYSPLDLSQKLQELGCESMHGIYWMIDDEGIPFEPMSEDVEWWRCDVPAFFPYDFLAPTEIGKRNAEIVFPNKKFKKEDLFTDHRGYKFDIDGNHCVWDGHRFVWKNTFANKMRHKLIDLEPKQFWEFIRECLEGK